MTLTEFKSGRINTRNELLNNIVNYFSLKSSVLAIYGFGSLGRGEQDEFSDLDIEIVFKEDSISEEINKRENTYSKFGEILLIYETAQNNPLGGNYSSIFYKNDYGPQHIDIYFCPEKTAVKPYDFKTFLERKKFPDTKWVYDREAKPIRSLEERVNFTIFMSFICIKKFIRRQKEKEILEVTFDAYKSIKSFTDNFRELNEESKGLETVKELLNALKLYSNSKQYALIIEVEDYLETIKKLYI